MHLRTKLVNGAAEVEMVEHVMAALYGMQIDNCLIECDACEMPGLDGSAGAIAIALQQAGLETQSAPANVLVLVDTMQVGDQQSSITAHPADEMKLKLVYHLDYGPNSPIPSTTSMAVLSRGYGLVRLASGAVVTRAAQVAPGDVLATRMQDGEIASVVAGGARRKRSVKSETCYNQPSLL